MLTDDYPPENPGMLRSRSRDERRNIGITKAALDVMHGGRAMMRLAAHRYTRRHISRAVLCEGFLVG